MRIRELYLNNFRSFRGERRVSFVDPNTDLVRPVTVLAGSNGTGKTTVLELIEALLRLLIDPEKPADILKQASSSSLIILTIEFSNEEINWIEGNLGLLFQQHSEPKILHLVVGNYNLNPELIESIGANAHGLLSGKPGYHLGDIPDVLAAKLQNKVANARTFKESEWLGGFLYFPFDRQIGKVHTGAIERPKTKPDWVFRYTTPARWQGSLEQLWVWQNYLDLEKGAGEAGNLTRFVDSVEKVLGENRRITIDQGQVVVPVGWSVNEGEPTRVPLDQLPSGEQQVLLLFGELARWRRRGGIIAIDEVENSLHPTLQRLVMWNLRRLAQEWDAQVIVATHSLEVIQSVRGGAFINLDYPENRFDLPLAEEDTRGAS